MMQSLLILSGLLAAFCCFGLATRQTMSGLAVSISLGYVAAILLLSTAAHFLSGDAMEAAALLTMAGLGGGSFLLLCDNFLLRSAALRRLPILAELTRSFLWLFGGMTLVLVFKLEDQLIGNLPPALLTLVIAAGLIGLWLVRRTRKSGTDATPASTDKEPVSLP